MTAPPALSEASTQPLQRDVACRCGYNLRGLNASSRCPECGIEILAVLIAGGASPVSAIDPGWARAVRYAVILAICGELARTLSAFIPDATFRFRHGSVGWYVYFTLIPVWWVVQWYAAMKLTRTDSPNDRLSERIVLWSLRAVATSFMAFPFVIGELVIGLTGGDPMVAHVVIRASAMLVAALFFLRVRDVCRRLGADALAGQATLLAMLMPFTMWSSRTWTNWWVSEDMFASFMRLPSYQFGDTAWLRYFVQTFPKDVAAAMDSGPNLAIAAACWVVLIRLLILAWRAAARR